VRLFGLEITRAKAAPGQQAWSSSSGGWWPIVREPFTGAWQRNMEERTDTLIAYHAVYSCITLIASDVAKCRLRLVEETADGIWAETYSPAFSPVLEKPNSYQSRVQFVESWMTSKLVNGNAYVLKSRDERNVVTALYVLDPTRIKVLVAPDGQVYYELYADNLAGVRDNVTVPASEIIHDMTTVRFHPLCGLPPMAPAALAATQGLDIQRQQINLFRNSGRPGGILAPETVISKEAGERLKEQWEQNYTGINSGKVAVFTNPLKFQPLSQMAKDAQLVEQLGLSGKMVCSAFNVPAHMVGVGDPPSYNNIEALNQQYYSQCLQKYIEAIELCLDDGLGLTGVPGRSYGTEFDLSYLLRMDTATLVKTITDAVGAGVMEIDEGRALLNLGPTEGGKSCYLQQQNYSLAALAKRDASDDPFGTAAPKPAPAAANDDEDDEEKNTVAFVEEWRRKSAERLNYA
jgi:HK97 family phage portal protein